MMLTRYISREVRRRPGRAILTLAGIVIGVQALVAIPLTIQTTRHAQRDLFEGLTGKADLEVVPSGQGGFSPALEFRLADVKGVSAVVPVIQSAAAIRGPSGLVPVLALGVDFERGDKARDYALVAGELPKNQRRVLLEKSFARSLGLETGAKLWLLSPSGVAELQVAGLLEPRGVAAVNGGAVAIMPLVTAQQIFGLEGRVNNLNVVLDDGVDAKRVTQELSTRLPAGLTVQVPAARATLAQETTANTERLLTILSITSLLAGAFVILNSFLMSLGERRHALAILRALGATRRQITRLLFLEALGFGVVGTAVGIPLGLGAAYVMAHLMSQFAGLSIPEFRITAGPIVLAGLMGPGVAVLATYFPAKDAGRRSPLPELRRRPEAGLSQDARPKRWPVYLGFGLLALFAVVYALILSGRFPGRGFAVILPACLALVLLGGALAMGVALAPLLRLTERLLRPVLGVEAGLAVRQLRRHPTRTSLVVGVMVISVVLSVGFGGAILNSVRDARQEMVRIFTSVDFLVIPTPVSGTELLPVAMPEAYADAMAKLTGVRRVSKGTVFPTRAAGHQIKIFARSCRVGEDTGFRFVGGSEEEVREGLRREEEVREGLRRGEVVIGTALSRRTGLGPGDGISIETRLGPRVFKIAGLAADYNAGGMLALMEWDHAKRFFEMEGARYVYVTAEPDERSNVERRLQVFCEEHNLLLHSRVEFVGAVDRLVNGVIGCAWALLALVFVVASLGVTNSLTMNVLEQTRELGILRAVAMTRRQVGKMIVCQALAIGMISIVPGVLLGVLLSLAAIHAHYALVGLRISYGLEPALLIGCVAMALIVAVAASLPAARRAGRLAIIRALRYE
jgi:putative ABC transport system permease protein